MLTEIKKGLSPSVSKERLEWYAHSLFKTTTGVPKRIQPLHLRSESNGGYLFLSRVSQYECHKIKILGFNKLSTDWDLKEGTLTRRGIPQSYRDFTDCRDNDTYPISPTINGVDGISMGLYCVVTSCLEYEDTKNYLLWIGEGKSKLIDLRWGSEFSIYQLSQP